MKKQTWNINVTKQTTLVISFDEPIDMIEAIDRFKNEEYEDILDETNEKILSVVSAVWIENWIDLKAKTIHTIPAMKIARSLAIILMEESPSFRMYVSEILFPNLSGIRRDVYNAVNNANGKIDAIKKVKTIYNENPEAFLDAYPQAELTEWGDQKSLGLAWLKKFVESFCDFNWLSGMVSGQSGRGCGGLARNSLKLSDLRARARRAAVTPWYSTTYEGKK